MIYLRSHTIRFRRSGKGRRGSVIVLVVAVLALLAVIGTVYIVSARSERSSAEAAATAVNLDNAQKAVNDMVTQVIGESTYDAHGDLGGKSTGDVFGTHGSRRYDMPEGNPYALVQGTFPPVVSGLPVTPNGPFSTLSSPGVRDESWLVDSIYRFNSAYFDPYQGVYYGIKSPANPQYNTLSLLTYGLFDPATGQYDIPIYQPQSGDFPPRNFSLPNMFRVVADIDRLPTTLPLPSPAPDTTAFTPPDADAYIQLLPYSEASGVRYRFGIRIVDTSSMANLNVGTIYSNSTDVNLVNSNTFYNGYALNPPPVPAVPVNPQGISIFNSQATYASADVAGNLNSAAGRAGSWNGAPFTTAPAEYVWSQAAFNFENPSTFFTSPFDSADELELRSYGNFGTLAVPRVANANAGAPIWPNTLGNRDPNIATVKGSTYRNFFTTYSYSRVLRPIADPLSAGVLSAFRVTPTLGFVNSPPSGTSYVFPPFPAPVAANPDVSVYTTLSNQQAADRLVVAATNIATLLELVPAPTGFGSHPDACSFAANYLSFIGNAWSAKSVTDLAGGAGNINIFTLPWGPSLVDSQGICVRLSDGITPTQREYGSTGDLHSETTTIPGKVYLGYAAQPFINEVAEIQTTVDPGGGNPLVKTVTDWAIELYNPYNVALSLADYKLRLGSVDVDLSLAATGKDLYVPARGYFVICKAAGAFSTSKVNAAAVKFDDASHTIDGINGIYLMRSYTTRGSVAALNALGAVDQYDITAMTAILPDMAANTGLTYYERRGNGDTDTTNPTLLDRWQAVQETANSKLPQSDGITTLGAINPADGSITPAPLYDRYLDDVNLNNASAIKLRSTLRNVAEFDKIMRIASEIDTNSVPPGQPVDDGVIATQMNARATLATTQAELMGTQIPMDAAIHFDFRPTTGIAGFKPGDPRAATLLDCLAFTDRVSEFGLDLGDNNSTDRGISKLRIPGMINVNTAAPEVLASVPILNAQPGLIGVILAYRWRTVTTDPRIPLAFRPTTAVDFTGFSGYGIRSLGELEIAISYAQDPAGTASKTLFDRESLWAQMYNSLTVRSDTFVVYAYLEAVRQNPRYGGVFNNSSDWYLNNSTVAPIAITDDPTNTTAPLLRLSRRRWVAIVDRSNANASRYIPNTTPPVLDPRFVQPRIIAAKELSQ